MGRSPSSSQFTVSKSHWREFIQPILLSAGGTSNYCFFSRNNSFIFSLLCSLTHIKPPTRFLYSSGGHFGSLEIVYSTSEIDIVGLAQADGQNLLMYYDLPKPGVPSTSVVRTANITGQTDPLAACAAICLREQACQAFSLTSGVSPPSCTWVTLGADQLTPKSQVMTYAKNITAAAVLFSAQAVAGSDYTPVTAQSAFMDDQSGVANLSVPILTDKFPEMDESFSIQILKVNPDHAYFAFCYSWFDVF